MKLLALILATFSLLITALYAADTITLLDNGHITRNGIDLNNAGDALKNNLVTVAEFNAALQTKLDAAGESAADLAALKARIDTVLNNMLTEELKTGDGPRAAVLRTLIRESQKSDKQIKSEAIAAEIAAKQAELQKLNGGN